MPAIPTTVKGKRTREQLLAAARRVFARDGFVKARMSDIAQEAGISMGGLYRYFGNKEDIFANLLGNTHDRLFRASQPHAHRFADDPFVALLEANEGYLREWYEERDVMRVLVEAATVDLRFREFWWGMRDRHIQRFLHSLQSAPPTALTDRKEIEAGADAMACMVEQAAYVWYGREDLDGPGVPIETAALVLTRAWHGLFYGAAAGDGSPLAVTGVEATRPVTGSARGRGSTAK
jgi:AcrR family transcriptional regulator